MAAKQRILVVDDDPNLNRLLQFALVSEGFSVSIATTGLAGIEVALRERPDLAVVDVGLPELDGFEVCRRLRAAPTLADIPIILLTARADLRDKLAGFEAGADEYVVKPVAIEELIARIRALFLRAAPSTRAAAPELKGEGQMWTLFSLKGGVGVSSLAVNLAIALRQDCADSVALVDLNLECGTIESMLNLPPSTRLASPERLGPEDWDAELITQLLTSHQSKVEVLLPPSSPTASVVIGFESVRRILTILKETFQYVVVDTASALSDLNWSVLELSDLIMVILTSDINSWKAGSRALDIFKSLDISLQKVVLVYNHNSPASALTPRQAESFFRFPLASEIPYGGAAFLSSVNLGVPLLLNHPDHPATVALKELARKLITRQPEPVSAPAEESRGILARLRTRYAPG